MAKKSVPKPNKIAARSFRFPEGILRQLRVISSFSATSATQMMVRLVSDEYERLQRKHPDEVRRLEKLVSADEEG